MNDDDKRRLETLFKGIGINNDPLDNTLIGDNLRDSILGNTGPRAFLENAVAQKVRDLYTATTDMNEKDGWFAAKVTYKCDHDNCEVMKTAWVFENKSEAQEYAEEMLQRIAKDMLEANLKKFNIDCGVLNEN